ncbi:BQ2448_1162 [Microbotryum intermedium]|uniref:BQ2448_1162 protein n=1 Tax=Microbotryum intermedium TaxID=269621 RepID=A0A238FF57_9BASI|nr:BQ2448_1162 [Microbotryum intermedium]
MRYLMCDSWSGLGGQFTTVLPLLLLASMTSRIAILPSFNDEQHYGKGVIMKMSLIYDLDRFREITGILLVEQDDVKIRDPNRTLTKPDEIGCYHASPWFSQALSYGDHNIQQVEIQVERQKVKASGTWDDFHYESFVLFDADFDRRMADTRAYLEKQGKKPEQFPPNIASATPSSSLMCYTNLWNLERAGHQHVSEVQRKMMAPIWSGHEPEWYFVGRYIDFAPRIWEIALNSVRTTMRSTKIPQELITMHIRRGDFLTWCPMQVNCVPTLDAFASALNDLRAELSKLLPNHYVDKFPVLVSTDERDDQKFLGDIKARGWIISDTPSDAMERSFGEGWKWADSAIAQAILSLGRRGFVGTSNSQISQLTQLRIQTYYHEERAPTRMVDKSGAWT